MAATACACAPTCIRQERERALNARAVALAPLSLELDEAMKLPDVTSWEQQAYTCGLRAGWEEGWQAGQHAGRLQVVLRQLTFRFGKLDQATHEEIEDLAPEPLADLAEALQCFAQPDDLRLWLNWRIILVELSKGSLRRQLGKLEPAMEAEIEGLSSAQRKKLDSVRKNFATPQDLEKWLRRRTRARKRS